MELITAFQEFGLSGAVIGALFYQNWSLIKELRALNDATDRRIDEQATRHNAEREKWLASVNRMTDAIEKLFEKPCQTVGRFRIGENVAERRSA
jgi:hypothetical protein